jgi:hypothetical protein
MKSIAPTGLQRSSTALNDIGHRRSIELKKPSFNKAGVSTGDSEDAAAFPERVSNHGSNCGIHSWRITSAGEYGQGVEFGGGFKIRQSQHKRSFFKKRMCKGMLLKSPFASSSPKDYEWIAG